MVKIPQLEEMLKAGMHFGHRTSKWHPKMEPFIFTKRNGVHIIDLRKTEKMLVSALEFLGKMAAEDKIVLFVGTKTQVKKPLERAAKDTNMPYVSGKWLGGTLTNFTIIKKVVKKYTGLLEEKESGQLSKYTKKERLDFDREIERLEMKVGGLVTLKRLPDALFVWDIKTEANAVMEAKKKNIPVAAVCDTNTDPTPIKYVIPSNDDATKTIKLLLNVIKDAMVEAKAKANKNGQLSAENMKTTAGQEKTNKNIN
jgi:small subunit ribosomal protein S2